MLQGKRRVKAKPVPVILDRENLRQAEDFLRQADPVLGKVMEMVGPCLLCEENERNPFEQLCIAIIGQQLSVKAAHTIKGRVVEKLGVLEPEAILAAGEEELRACGLSRAKIRYVKALSSMVNDGRLRLKELAELPSEAVLEELLKVPGIGRWTAEMFLLFNLRHSNVLALADVGPHRAVH